MPQHSLAFHKAVQRNVGKEGFITFATNNYYAIQYRTQQR